MTIKGKRFKVWKAQVSAEKTDLAAGSVVENKKNFAISFANKTVLNLLEVQPAGKKKMTIKNFINGQGSNFKVGEEIVDD